MITIIHTDDEMEFIHHFKKLVTAIPDIEYKGGFTNAQEAYNFLANNLIDVLFLDVDMPGKNGLWLAEELKEQKIDIIFVTAHAGFAVQAFEACAIDFIIKPVTKKNIENAIARYKLKKEKNQRILMEQMNEFYNNYIPKDSAPKRIFINDLSGIHIIDLSEVMYFTANKNYTEIFLKDGSKKTSSKNLKIYSDALANNQEFSRIHKSYIINKNFAKTILKNSKKHQVHVVMSDGKMLEMSYLKSELLIKELSI